MIQFTKQLSYLINKIYICSKFLNQACVGLRPARAWFLRIASVRELQYVCLCVHPRGYQ